MTKALAFIFSILCATFTGAAGADRFERLLFPIAVVNQPGAFGTLWNTQVVVRNEGEVSLEIFTSECQFRCDLSRCLLLFCTLAESTPPGSEFPDVYSLTRGTADNPARLLHVPKGHSQNVFASLRVVESTGRGNEYGVEIPVVREDRLFSDVLWLPDVPIRSEARTHLRIYGVESPGGAARVRLRVYERNEESARIDLFVDLGEHHTPMRGNYDQDTPSYRWVDLSSLIPAGSESSFRVRVDSLTEGLKFWAMASLTSNASQQVTIISPQ